MKRIIVNADDFGVCTGVVKGIVHGFRHGIITSTSLMLTVPASMAAVEAAVRTPTLDVGVHLTFTEGWPVMAAEWVPSLVNNEGRFLTDKEWYSTGRQPRLAELEAEFKAQVALPRQSRLPISHLDMHTAAGYLLPGVFELTVSLAADYDLAIRYPFGENAGVLVEALAQSAGVPAQQAHAMVERYRRVVADKGIRHPDRFVEAFPGGNTDPLALARLIASLPDGTTELLTHPAFARGSRRAMGRFADVRAAELAALCDPAVRQAVAAGGIQLVNFRQL